jgi:hypothetical protein
MIGAVAFAFVVGVGRKTVEWFCTGGITLGVTLGEVWELHGFTSLKNISDDSAASTGEREVVKEFGVFELILVVKSSV